MKKVLFILVVSFLSLPALAQQTHSGTISWSASSTTGVTEYRIYRGLCNGSVTNKQCSLEATASQVGTLNLPSGSLTFTDTPLTAGTSYYWYVTAVVNTQSDFGESAPSNHCAATVPKNAVTVAAPGPVTCSVQ